MAGYPTSFQGRTFVERENYSTLERYPAGYAKNHVFCITVDRAIEIPRPRDPSQPKKPKSKRKKIVVRVIRWRARIDREHGEAKQWVQLRSYNIRGLKEWENVASFVNSIISGDIEDAQFEPIPIEDHSKLLENERKIDQLEAEIRKLRTEERALQIESATFRRRVEIMKKNKQKYQTLLNDFKELIDKPETTETDVHRFIKKNKPFWFFGLEYTGLDSKVQFPPQTKEYEFDLMLRRYDNYYDLVELKGPNERLFSQVTTHRKKPLQKLSEAMGQVFTYLHICDKDTTMKNLLKPKALVVIGKEGTDDSRERRIFSSFLNNVEIITYSDLFKRGEKLLEYIETL